MITEAKIIIPVPDEHFDDDKWLEALNFFEDELIRIAGGLTVIRGYGRWVNPDDGEVSGEHVSVYVVATTWTQDKKNEFYTLAKKMIVLLNQKAIYTEMLGKVKFIT